jgi:Polysaccharide lyase/Bacterial Ig-like domain
MATDTSKITTAADELSSGLTKGGSAAKTLGQEIANAIASLDSRVTALEEGGGTEPIPPEPPSGDTPTIVSARTASSANPVFDFPSGDSTRSNNVAVFGTAKANASVTVFRGSSQLGTTTADSGGKWRYELGVLTDGSHTITAKIGSGPASAAFNFTVVPSVKGAPIGQNITTGSDFEYAAQMWSAHNDPDNNKALIARDTHTLDFECRPNDIWPSAPSNRTELQCHTQKADGDIFNWTYEFFMPSTDPINNAGVSHSNGGMDGSLVVGQIHSASGPPLFCWGMGDGKNGDCLGVIYKTPSQYWIWDDPSKNLARGVWHKMDVQVKAASSGGYVRAWCDGKQMANTTKCYDTKPFYMEFGFYRNPKDGNTQTQHVSYRNMLVVYSR